MDSTGFMICTDPNAKGIVPADVSEFGGRTYHCTHDQHKEVINGSVSTAESSILAAAVGVAAGVVSTYWFV